MQLKSITGDVSGGYNPTFGTHAYAVIMQSDCNTYVFHLQPFQFVVLCLLRTTEDCEIYQRHSTSYPSNFTYYDSLFLNGKQYCNATCGHRNLTSPKKKIKLVHDSTHLTEPPLPPPCNTDDKSPVMNAQKMKIYHQENSIVMHYIYIIQKVSSSRLDA